MEESRAADLEDLPHGSVIQVNWPEHLAGSYTRIQSVEEEHGRTDVGAQYWRRGDGVWVWGADMQHRLTLGQAQVLRVGDGAEG